MLKCWIWHLCNSPENRPIPHGHKVAATVAAISLGYSQRQEAGRQPGGKKVLSYILLSFFINEEKTFPEIPLPISLA